MTDKDLRISEARITRALAGGEQVSARPKNVWIVPDRPKTRSGKIMRRVPASISDGKHVGGVTTLPNPDIVEQIRQMVQGDDTETGS